MSKPVEIKATSTSDFLKSIKAKVDARAKLSPEERAEQDRATGEILRELKLDPEGPSVFIVRGR